MLKDSERYILTTARASVIRSVLSLILAKAKPQINTTPETYPALEAALMEGCDRMVLELRRPPSSASGARPAVTNLHTSRLGRVLVVTGEATTPEMLRQVEALRHPHFYPKNLTSSLHTFAHTLSCTLRLAHPQN